MQNPSSTETLLAEWEEPAVPAASLPRPYFIALPIVCLGIAGLLVAGGIKWDNFTFYMAAAVTLAAGFFLISQGRAVQPSREISLTSLRLIVGKNGYPLADLAGFWLEAENGMLTVNVEHQRPTPFPISFFYSKDDAEEARSLLLQVLPEVEPREKNLGDKLGAYFRF